MLTSFSPKVNGGEQCGKGDYDRTWPFATPRKSDSISTGWPMKCAKSRGPYLQ